jgi:hypothetical protein
LRVQNRTVGRGFGHDCFLATPAVMRKEG